MKRKKKFWLVGGVVGGLTFVALIFLVYLIYRLIESHQLMRFMTVDYELGSIDEKAAWVGTTLGGVIGLRVALAGSVLAFVGAMFTFIAFYIQYEANNIQQGQFTEQKKDLAKERFENKFFAMLDIYRSIVQSVEVEQVGVGKRAFHFMFFEFKALYVRMWELGLLKTPVTGGHDEGERYESQRRRERVLKVAFNLFINGVGSVNQRIKDTCSGLISSEELECILQDVQQIQQRNRKIFTGDVRYLKDYKGKHFPVFDGHRFRLVNYYRQVYMIIHYLYEQDEQFLDEGEKEFYLQLFCSQMSEHEIALIKAYDSSNEKITVEEENIKEIFNVFHFHSTLDWDNQNFFSIGTKNEERFPAG